MNKFYNICADIFFKVSTTAEETGVTTETIGDTSKPGNKINDLLNATNNTSEITSYIKDIIYILVVIVIALAFLTLLMYLYRFLKRRRDPYYKKNDDDFLDD